MEYRQLIISERHIIMIRHKDGGGIQGIAWELGRSQSCIRRELARNACPYDAEAAQKRAAGLKRARRRRKPRRRGRTGSSAPGGRANWTRDR